MSKTLMAAVALVFAGTPGAMALGPTQVACHTLGVDRVYVMVSVESDGKSGKSRLLATTARDAGGKELNVRGTLSSFDYSRELTDYLKVTFTKKAEPAGRVIKTLELEVAGNKGYLWLIALGRPAAQEPVTCQWIDPRAD